MSETTDPTRRFNRRASLALLAVCTSIGVAACAAPTVDVQQAALSKLTTTGFLVNLDLAVNNPNTYTLPLRHLDWNLDLYNAPFTRGGVDLDNRINPQSTGRVRVPLGIRFQSVKAGVNNILAGKNIPWGIGGKCDFNTPVGPVFVRFAKDGVWANPIKNTGVRIPNVNIPRRNTSQPRTTQPRTNTPAPSNSGQPRKRQRAPQ